MVRQIEKDVLTWQGTAPVAPGFGDVYYSDENGLEEAEHTFLHGTGAPDTWNGRDTFTIAETGFGTGLNFLVAWRLWINSGQKGSLTFVSVEGFPLSVAALEAAHKTFPDIAPYAEALRAAWPPPSPGMHMRTFENGRIRLLLLIGNITACLPQLSTPVDAWFLDGFSPAKNPDMWSETVLDHISRLSKPGTRFATFTAAGFVKRGMRNRGFDVQKTSGYGRKRERLIGQKTSDSNPPYKYPIPEWACPPETGQKPNTALVIGAGIAGACVAYALKARGLDVTVLRGTTPAASSVPVAILAPSLQRSHRSPGQFAATAFAHACWYPPYKGAWAPERGVHQIGIKPEERETLAALCAFHQWPDDWLQQTDEGVFLPQSGSLDTEKALATLLAGTPTLATNAEHLEKTATGWRVHTAAGPLNAEIVIIAAGPATNQLLPGSDFIGLKLKAGQCEVVKTKDSPLPAKNYASSGYFTAPIGEMGAEIQTMGSSFEEQASPIPPAPCLKKRAKIISSAAKTLGLKGFNPFPSESWTGVRAAASDYLPVVGPVPRWQEAQRQYALLAKDANTKGLGAMPFEDGLYITSGFGSKGYQQAPLAAEYIAALVCGEPSPIPLSLVPALHPARFLIRSIIRRQ